MDAFWRFIQMYPVLSTDPTLTLEVLTTFITSSGITRKLVYDKGTPS